MQKRFGDSVGHCLGKPALFCGAGGECNGHLKRRQRAQRLPHLGGLGCLPVPDGRWGCLSLLNSKINNLEGGGVNKMLINNSGWRTK